MLKVKKNTMEKNNKKRFVLVHGLCHGAWTWYKVKTYLEAEGHCVTAVDLAASGINMTRVEEIQTLKDYCKPLLECLSSDDDKVILVAHSMGGICATLAADMFPSKIFAIVFLTAFMPDTTNPPAYVYEKLIRSVPQEEWFDTVFGRYGKPDCPLEFALLGPKYMAKKMYQLSPVQGQEALVRKDTDPLHVYISYVKKILWNLKITNVG
ncbi:methylesterase 4 isoform X2 [Capsella rubella]|nr:methylesterase 4 isoform X2 [Capsella rubella]